MPRIKFTAATIRNLRPADKTIEYYDSARQYGAGSLGLRISPKGKRTWFVGYKVNGRTSRYTLGIYPDLSLVDARHAAADVMTRVNAGDDPQAERQEYRIADTFEDLWADYTRSPRYQAKATKTRREEERLYNKHVATPLGSLRVVDIRKKHLSPILSDLASTAPVYANRLYSLLHVVLKHAINAGLIDIHPMYGMDKPGGRELPRQRKLSDDEINTLWPALPDYFRLILLTCQRPGEVLAIHTNEIDIRAATWTIPADKTKTRREHIIPLSKQAMDIITALVDKVGNGYLFPGRAPSGHVEWTNQTRARIHRKTGITEWTAHDLRRTGRTMLSRLQVPNDIAERILNHSRGRIEETYDLHAYMNEKRAALDKLGREIARVIGQWEPAKIVELKRQA